MSKLANAALIILMLCSYAFADDNSSANKLFIEATQLINKAHSERNAKAESALISEAIDRLDAIVEKYPGSDLAVKIATEQFIGNVNILELKGRKMELSRLLCYKNPTRDCLFKIAIEDALKLNDIDRSNVVPSVVWSLAKCGKFDEALKVVDSIKDASLRLEALLRILIIDRNKDTFRRILAIYETDFTNLPEKSDIVYGSKQWALREIIYTALQTGFREEAKTLIKHKINSKSEYMFLASHDARNGHLESALAMLTEKGLRNDPGINMVYESAAAYFAEKGDSLKAMEMVNMNENSNRKVIILCNLAIQIKDKQYLLKALELARREKKLASHVQKTIVMSEAKLGMLKEARELLVSIVDKIQYCFAINSIAEESKDAKLFERAINECKSIDFKDRNRVLSSISYAQARAGFINDALATIKKITQGDIIIPIATAHIAIYTQK